MRRWSRSWFKATGTYGGYAERRRQTRRADSGRIGKLSEWSGTLISRKSLWSAAVQVNSPSPEKDRCRPSSCSEQLFAGGTLRTILAGEARRCWEVAAFGPSVPSWLKLGWVGEMKLGQTMGSPRHRDCSSARVCGPVIEDRGW
jgi:hypothetical protein